MYYAKLSICFVFLTSTASLLNIQYLNYSDLNDLPFRFLRRSSWFRGGMSLEKIEFASTKYKSSCHSVSVEEGLIDLQEIMSC